MRDELQHERRMLTRDFLFAFYLPSFWVDAHGHVVVADVEMGEVSPLGQYLMVKRRTDRDSTITREKIRR